MGWEEGLQLLGWRGWWWWSYNYEDGEDDKHENREDGHKDRDEGQGMLGALLGAWKAGLDPILY